MLGHNRLTFDAAARVWHVQTMRAGAGAVWRALVAEWRWEGYQSRVIGGAWIERSKHFAISMCGPRLTGREE